MKILQTLLKHFFSLGVDPFFIISLTTKFLSSVEKKLISLSYIFYFATYWQQLIGVAIIDTDLAMRELDLIFEMSMLSSLRHLCFKNLICTKIRFEYKL